MVYVPAKKSDDGVAKVIYTSKDRKTRKIFNALEWLARLVTHIPSRYEHTVRYYGFFSNKSRGMRKKADADDVIPIVILIRRILQKKCCPRVQPFQESGVIKVFGSLLAIN